MAYTNTNFKTKKELKIQVELWNKAVEMQPKGFHNNINPVRCHQPGLGPDLTNYTGRIALEGPHYPAAHTWYAQAELKDGIVIKVK